MKSNERNNVAVGVLVLAAAVVFIALFRFLVVGGLVVVGLAVVALVVWLNIDATRSQDRPGPEAALGDTAGADLLADGRRAGPRAVEHARRTGVSNMRTAWISWHLKSLPEQEDNRDPRLLTGTLAVAPQPDWDVDRLRLHGRALWSLRTSARVHGLLEPVDARLDRVVATISDLTDDEFDTSLGQVNDQFLFHPDRQVRTAYLEGGAMGVEAIMEAVTAARAQAREDAATKAAAQSLARQRNAALHALRETYRPTRDRDAHAAWDEQVKRIEE
ncbi:hypothetical protein ACH9EU_17175 [Kocuria sp. M1R5S2]|uniref:hypothetical protein n=1 Tax=Kocuria rhizosphaerae TaxID=3376285 RepID=UPI00378BD796